MMERCIPTGAGSTVFALVPLAALAGPAWKAGLALADSAPLALGPSGTFAICTQRVETVVKAAQERSTTKSIRDLKPCGPPPVPAMGRVHGISTLIGRHHT